jgi:hypothetical protein
MIDTLVRLRPRVERSDVHARLRIAPGGYAVVTLHRPRLVDGPLFERALSRLACLSSAARGRADAEGRRSAAPYRLLGLDVDAIQDIPALLGRTPQPLAPPAGWDGRAAERIADVLLSSLSEAPLLSRASSPSPSR